MSGIVESHIQRDDLRVAVFHPTAGAAVRGLVSSGVDRQRTARVVLSSKVAQVAVGKLQAIL